MIGTQSRNFIPSKSAAPVDYCGPVIDKSNYESNFLHSQTMSTVYEASGLVDKLAVSMVNENDLYNQNVIDQLFTLPSLSIEYLNKSVYNYYMVVHKPTGTIASFGKFKYAVNYADTYSFKLIYLNNILSTTILDFLSDALGQLQDSFVEVPELINWKVIANPPDSIDSLVELLVKEQYNWKWFAHWLFDPYLLNWNNNYANFANTISLLHELKDKIDLIYDQMDMERFIVEESMKDADRERNDSGLDEFEEDSIRKIWGEDDDETSEIFEQSNTMYHQSIVPMDPLIYKAFVPSTTLQSYPQTRTSSMSSSELCRFEDDLESIGEIEVVDDERLQEALNMYKMDPTYSVEQYQVFIDKNEQKSHKTETNIENSKRLHVSNIPFKWNEKHLEDEFSIFGQIEHSTIIRTSDLQSYSSDYLLAQILNNYQATGQLLTISPELSQARSRGYGFITFKSSQDAEMAKHFKHQTWVCDIDRNGKKVYNPETNRKIEVNYATPKHSRH